MAEITSGRLPDVKTLPKKLKKVRDIDLAQCVRKTINKTALVKVLEEIANDKEQSAESRISAIKLLFERGYGKAPASIELNVTDNTPQHQIEHKKEDVLGILAVLLKSNALPEGVIPDGIIDVPVREVEHEHSS